MAGRNFAEFVNTLERGVVHIYAQVSFAASGVPTLQAWKMPQLNTNGSFITANANGYGGVGSIAQNGTGDYTFTFQANTSFTRLLGVDVVFDTSAVSGGAVPPAAPIAYIIAQSVNPTTQGTLATLRIGQGTYGNGNGNPDTASVGLYTFTFSNSSVGAN